METYKKIGIIVIILLAVFVAYILINSNSNSVVTNMVDDIESQLNDENYHIEKSKNSNVYSILGSNNDQDMKFTSYNIDTKTGILLSEQDILTEFNVTKDMIYDKINERLQVYYDEEIKEGYVDPYECDMECYKSFYRNIADIKDNYVLYVKNNKLYIYLSFNDDSMIDDKEYFENLKYNPYEIKM